MINKIGATPSFGSTYITVRDYTKKYVSQSIVESCYAHDALTSDFLGGAVSKSDYDTFYDKQKGVLKITGKDKATDRKIYNKLSFFHPDVIMEFIDDVKNFANDDDLADVKKIFLPQNEFEKELLGDDEIEVRMLSPEEQSAIEEELEKKIREEEEERLRREEQEDIDNQNLVAAVLLTDSLFGDGEDGFNPLTGTFGESLDGGGNMGSYDDPLGIGEFDNGLGFDDGFGF